MALPTKQFLRCFSNTVRSKTVGPAPVKKGEASESTASTTEAPRKQSRRFDAHTYSIWAREMARRGKPEEAISLLENVIAKKRLNKPVAADAAPDGKTVRDPTPAKVAIFNTAIDVCGHAGKFGRAWSLYNDMKKRGLRPEERTVASMLNALAESIERRPESQVDSNRIWEKALQLSNAVGEEGRSTFLLNGLLKVASRLEEIERMRTIFPIKQIPAEADEISFTLALNLLARFGRVDEAAAYFAALETKMGSVLSWRPVAAMLTLIRRDVMKEDGKLASKEWRDGQAALAMGYLGKLNHGGESSTDSSYTTQPIVISTLLLEICTKLHAWPAALSYISAWILPPVNQCGSLKAIRADIDEYVLSLALKCLANGPDPADACRQTFALFERLLGRGFRPSTNDINALLMVCSRAKLEGRADAFFRAHFRKRHAVLKPDSHSVYHLMAALHANGDSAYVAMVRDHWEWLKEAHNGLFTECKDSPRFTRYINRVD